MIVSGLKQEATLHGTPASLTPQSSKTLNGTRAECCAFAKMTKGADAMAHSGSNSAPIASQRSAFASTRPEIERVTIPY